MKMKKSIIVAIEGPDGVGKTTQCSLLHRHLIASGFVADLVKVPYDDGLTFDLIYRMLRSGSAKRWPILFQTLQFINKLLCQLTYIPFGARRYDFIIFDRWKKSCTVYGDCTGVWKSLTRFYERLLLEPDVTIVIDCPCHRTMHQDTYEGDELLQHRVSEMYAGMEDVIHVDGEGTLDEVHERLCEVVL